MSFIPATALNENRFELFAASLLALVIGLLSLIPAIAVAVVLDKVVHAKAYSTLVAVLVLLLFFHLAETVLGYLDQRLTEVVTSRVTDKTERALVELAQSADYSALERISSSTLTARYSSISGIVNTMVEWRIYSIVTPATFIAIFAAMAVFSFAIASAMAVLTAAYFIIHVWMSLRVKRAAKVLQADREHLVKRVYELFGSLANSRAMRALDFFMRRWSHGKDRLQRSHDTMAGLAAWQSVVNITYQRLVLAAILGIGAYQTIGGQLSVGQLVMANMLARQLASNVKTASSLFRKRATSQVEVEALDHLVEQLTRMHTAPEKQGRLLQIKAEAISFAYPGGAAPVLSGCSFIIPSGTIVAIGGVSGSGKTTLLKVLAGLYAASSGNIEFVMDAQDDTEIMRIGYMPQGDQIYSGTIEENIALGRPNIDESAVRWAARMSGSDEFILRLPDGFRHIASDFGQNLSGGQRQRICLARAVASRPQLLLLDEPTSALDVHTKQWVIESLLTLKGKSTCVVVTHDPDIMATADLHFQIDGNGNVHPVSCCDLALIGKQSSRVAA